VETHAQHVISDFGFHVIVSNVKLTPALSPSAPLARPFLGYCHGLVALTGHDIHTVAVHELGLDCTATGVLRGFSPCFVWQETDDRLAVVRL